MPAHCDPPDQDSGRQNGGPSVGQHSASKLHNNPREAHHQQSHGGGGGSSKNIIGRYELKQTLGEGNFSTVKLAQHRALNHLVAMKVVKTSVLSPDNLMKINREIDVLKKIGKHKHIVRLYQVIKTKRYFMLVTEYCPNGELYDYLVAKGRLSEAHSCDYFLQILSAVEYLHEHNIVHRDLKAENLLLADNYKTIKIADFGFANYFSKDKLLSTWCGSPPYAAPELFKGLKYIGPPVDIWSLGVILYVLVCGSLPFDGQNLVFLKSRVLSGKFRIPFFMSTECESLIRGMLRLNADKRFRVQQIRAHSWIAKYAPSRTTQAADSGLVTDSDDGGRAATCQPISCGGDLAASGEQELAGSGDRRVASSSEEAPPRVRNGNHQGDATDCPHPDASDRMQMLVETEMATAVSNMSLASSASHSHSHSQCHSQANDNSSISNPSASSSTANSRARSGRPECRSPMLKSVSKENSIDDQIIEFMVEDLRVSETPSPIRDSIASARFDDLHAIYRLLKDQPQMVFELRSKFKIPPLPVLSTAAATATTAAKQTSAARKPSITTGFFNIPAFNRSSSPRSASTTADQAEAAGATRARVSPLAPAAAASPQIVVEELKRASPQSAAINLIAGRVGRPAERHRKSDDQTWRIPPQLFLTPPVDNQTTGAQFQPTAAQDNGPVICGAEVRQIIARHSFDSTMQQLSNHSAQLASASCDNPNSIINISPRLCLWDSSILDAVSATQAPSNNMQPVVDNLASLYRPSVQQETCKSVKGVNDASSVSLQQQQQQNLAGITTNLRQIGALQAAVNSNLPSQMNSLALNAAVAHSSMISGCNTSEQKIQSTQVAVEFTPNNLINQHNTVMQAVGCDRSANSQALLDPSCIASGLERRASDGQASYNSLSANVDVDLDADENRKRRKLSNETNPESMS